MAEQDDARRDDGLGVNSRVNWSALFAGLFVTLTVFLVLGRLGAAVTLSAFDHVPAEKTISVAEVWGFFTALAAFCCGGWVVSRWTVAVSMAEAAIHGTVLWGVAFVALRVMAGDVTRAGYGVGTPQPAVELSPPETAWSFVCVLTSLLAAVGGVVIGRDLARPRVGSDSGEPSPGWAARRDPALRARAGG